MIETITIRNFQSIQDLTLDLAPLVVIVGPSSSGKSALIRALDTLIQNRRGTSFITHGERVASITATVTSSDPLRSGTLTLTRSTQQAPNAYTILPSDEAHPLYPKAEFTKLNGETPEPVSQFLGIAPGTASLVIASQFDKPYLLDASGSEVARTLGSLTNANIILNGARESNRQKIQSAQTLRTRAADLEAITARIPEFKSLAAQRLALERSETLLDNARSIQGQVKSLTALIDQVEVAERRIPALRAHLASLPEPEDIEARITAYVAARKRLTRYTESIQTVSSAQRGVQRAQADLVTATEAHTEAVADLKAGMADIAHGFKAHYLAHSKTIGGDGRLDAEEAAKLSAHYLATLES